MNRPASATRWYFNPTFIVVTGCLVAMVNYGVRSSFGLFTAPISSAHEWPREVFSFAMALQNLLWGAATPVVGALADRHGAARVLIAGAIVYAVGTAIMAFAGGPLAMNIGGGLMVGIGVAASSFGIVMAALGRIVPPERRSWAFGIATASGSLGQFVFAPLSGAFIAAFGWQQTLIILALSTLLIIPLALPLLGYNGGGSRTAAAEPDLTMGEAIRHAFRHRSYILLVSGFFVCGFQLAFITVHLPPYLAEHGISKEMAGLAVGGIGLFNVAGSYFSGMIGSRPHKRIPLSLIYVLRSLAIAAFILLPVTTGSIFMFTASMGFLWLSTVPLTMGLVTVMFGTRYMATLYGFVFFSHQLGSFLGVWLGGRLYDSFGTYTPVWWTAIALGIFAGLVHLPIRERMAPRFAAA